MASLSSKFLVPLTGAQGKTLFVPQFKDSYLAADYDCEYGKCLFLAYSSDVPQTTSSTLQSLPKYEQTLTNPKEGDTVFVFRLEDSDYEKVVKPFVDGKYSAIDRGYVNKFFPRDPLGPLWWNRLILDKDPKVVAYWKRRGVELPDGAEVWSKAKKEDETYDYKDEN